MNNVGSVRVAYFLMVFQISIVPHGNKSYHDSKNNNHLLLNVVSLKQRN